MTTAAPSEPVRPRVRSAERADLLAVYRIEQAAFPQPWPFSAFEQYLGQPGFLVADDGGPVGYVVGDTVSDHGRRLGHIKDLAVQEQRRREGIGARLLTCVVRVLEQHGVSAVKLEVRETNDRARNLYREHGFEQYDTVEGYYSNGEDALVLIKRL